MKKRQITSIMLSFVLVSTAFCAPFAQMPVYAAEEASTEEAAMEEAAVEEAAVEEAASEETAAEETVEETAVDYSEDTAPNETIEIDDAEPDDGVEVNGPEEAPEVHESAAVSATEEQEILEDAQSEEERNDVSMTGESMFEGTVSATTEGREAIPEDKDGKSSDDLFADYVNNSFGIQNGESEQTSGGRKRAPRSASSNLAGIERVIYEEIAACLPAIAAGERASTVFEINVDALGMEQTFWTAEELGVNTIFAVDGNGNIIIDDQGNATISEEAINEISERTEYDLFKIANALLADHPYQLYWCDKTQEINSSGYEVTAYYDDTAGDYVAGVVGSFTISFPVADEYSAGEYMVDTAVGQAVRTSVENAIEIVDQYADASDYDKLCGYRDEICDLASYNYEAAEGGVSYGNPWQMIWVFDGDPATEVVCEGYAKAFKYLCDRSEFDSDISCITVTGTMSGGTGDGPHMWDVVRMEDRRNYLADLTNTDEGTIGQGGELFLSAYTSGNAEDGYIFQCGDTDISYVYDDEMFTIFLTEDLIISEYAYGTVVPEITEQPRSVEAAKGDRVSFHVAVDSADVTYQWQYTKDGTTWNNCTSAGYNTDTFSFTMGSTMGGRKYRCVVTGGSVQKTSDAADLILKVALKITKQPVSVEAFRGEKVTFHVEANKEDVTYQWQYNKDGATWNNCTSRGYNKDTFSFTIGATMGSRQYRCVVTSGSEQKTSEAANLVIKEALEITEQPESVEAAKGDRVSFHVAANKADVTYQWQYTKDGATWNNCTSKGYNTDTFSFTMGSTMGGRQYRCVVTSGSEQKTSEAADLIIKAALEITEQPQSVEAAKGDRVSFHVAVDKADVTYQWQYTKDGTTWNNCTSAGYNTDTFSFTMGSTMGGRKYRCVVTRGSGQKTSDSADLTLKKALKITKQPESVEAAKGEKVTLHVEANVSDVTYQWQYTKDGTTWKNCSSAGYNTDTFAFSMKETLNNRLYRCVIKHGTKSVISDNALITLADESSIVRGECGDHAAWSLNLETGILTISGTGDIWDYEFYKPWDDYKTSVSKVIVQEGITHLGERVFFDYKSIVSVELPDSLCSIGGFALCGCSSLSELTIPSGVTSIGEAAFEDCKGLTSIEIPENVTKIESRILCYCDNLERVIIPDGVTEIGPQAFYYCHALTSIDIPDSVVTIGRSAFEHCESLTDIYLPENVETIREHAFEECLALTGINVSPDNDTFTSVDGILYDKALTALLVCPCGITNTEVIIPDSVTVIRSRAFIMNTNITDVSFPDSLTRIESEAFYFCQNLSGVVLHDGVTAIDDFAFYNCGITSVQFTSSLTSIGNYTFGSCEKLELCYYIGTMAEWSSIEVGVTNNCLMDYARIICSDGELVPTFTWDIVDGVFTLYGEGETEDYWWEGDDNGSTAPWSDRRDEITKVVINEGITGIYGPAFAYCPNLTEVSLPNTLKTIGNTVFDGSTQLESITIPEGVESIGGCAFYGCFRLKTIYLPRTLKNFKDEYTFAGCALSNIYYSGTYSEWRMVEGREFATIPDDCVIHCGTETNICDDFGYQIIDGKCVVTAYTGSSDVINVPAQIEGYPVKEVDFGPTGLDGSINTHYCEITEVNLPVTVERLGDGAFKNWTGLQTLTGLDSVQYVGDYCFSGSGVQALEFTGNLSYAGLYAFDANELRTITIPDTLTWKGLDNQDSGSDRETVFLNHEHLAYINLIETGNTPTLAMDGPALLTADMKRLVCYPCKNPLTTYRVPDSVTVVYQQAFDIRDINYTEGLYELYIPSAVHAIYYNVFYKELYVTTDTGEVKRALLPRLVVEEGSDLHLWLSTQDEYVVYWRLAGDDD